MPKPLSARLRSKTKGKKRRRSIRPKTCRLCEDGSFDFGFKDTELLARYLTEKGKILPRRITGICMRHQRMLSRAIKRARNAALLP